MRGAGGRVGRAAAVPGPVRAAAGVLAVLAVLAGAAAARLPAGPRTGRGGGEGDDGAAVLAAAAAAEATAPGGQLPTCEDLPPAGPPAEHVRELRTTDIKAVMAMGDSMSAGFAMMAGLPVEFRGHVTSVGVAKGAVTLPHLFAQVNGGRVPAGGSTGLSDPFEDAVIYPKPGRSRRPNNPKTCHLNAAQSNAHVEHLQDQVDYLVQQVGKEPGLDVARDWKLLTVFIGANNLLTWCGDGTTSEQDADKFERYLDEALAGIQARIPRVLVNLIALFDAPNAVQPFVKRTAECKIFHHFVDEGGCVGPTSAAQTRAYNQKMRGVADRWNAKALPDFAVALQPVLFNLTLPGMEYLSHLDCFHPSKLANEKLSIALWNHMLAPPDAKPGTIQWNERFQCPTADTKLWVG